MQATRGRTIGILLLIILALMLIAALPIWPHSVAWGYYPSGGAGLLVAVAIMLRLAGYV